MELQDRCRGLMVGLAVGNLLGILCEGWKREEIRLGWPDGVRDIEAGTGYPDDDDLAQAVLLAAACHGAEALDVDDLARRFWVWGEGKRPWHGACDARDTGPLRWQPSQTLRVPQLVCAQAWLGAAGLPGGA